MIDETFIQAVQSVFPLYDGVLSRDTTAAEVPGWDSFGHIQLMFELEDRYGIKIDGNRALACKNVGELVDLLRG